MVPARCDHPSGNHLRSHVKEHGTRAADPRYPAMAAPSPVNGPNGHSPPMAVPRPRAPYSGHPDDIGSPESAPYLNQLVGRIVKETQDAQARTATPIPDSDGLSWPSIGTKARKEETEEEKEARFRKMRDAVATLLECIGEDPAREGLLKTPDRYAKALMFLTKGYEEDIAEVLNGAVFHEEGHDDMVIVRDIEVHSLCEHHLVPFVGTVSIGYIPNQRVIGLSKLARIADLFSRRLQVQERLTKQIAVALQELLQPLGVAVVMECTHMCMVMRGVQKVGSKTITSTMLGDFRRDSRTRQEFLQLIRSPRSS
ncbi:GTP cyclohydrolase I [Hyaloraphidium curvatum]|nr:GTP cyclohydrolase I [Hyaloraphidium curvatum]